MASLQRLLFLFICTVVGFVCGTLYLFSAYGPQLAIRLDYTGSETSLVAFAGTLGIALSGVPAGVLIDTKGFSVSVVLGALFTSVGYLGLKNQYDRMSSHVWLSVLYMFLTGIGSTTVNSVLIKCSAISFPSLRGIATSFPIASYGLSAFVFSFLASVFFEDDTSGFLGLLGWSSLLICLLSLPVFYYADLVFNKGQTMRSTLHSSTNSGVHSRSDSFELQAMGGNHHQFPTQTSLSTELMVMKLHDHEKLKSPTFILKSLNFWIFFSIVGLLVALGQMYIYSVGFMAEALLHFTNDTLAIQNEQHFQVSTLSIFNCVGRLICGVLGDLISNQFGKSRTWVLVFPVISLLIVQILGFLLQDETYLGAVSSLDGFGYGFIWAATPQILIELFGVNALSFGWGFINLSPILPAYFLTQLFGSNFDYNLEELEGNPEVDVCFKGNGCYNRTFEITSVVATLTLGLVVWLIVRPILKGKSQKYSTVQ